VFGTTPDARCDPEVFRKDAAMIKNAASLVALTLLAAPAQAATLEGLAAYGDWRDDSPGTVRRITGKDLPPPLSTPSNEASPSVVPRPDSARLATLPGFEADVFADGLDGPRVIRIAPNGDIFVTESFAGQLRVFRAAPGGARPGKTEVFAKGLERPYGIAFYPPGADPAYVYVATPSKILRYPYRSGDLVATGPAQTVAELPGDGSHWTRDLALSPDGRTLYAAVGSQSNDAEHGARPPADRRGALESVNGPGASDGAEFERADVVAMNPDGSGRRVFATGLRNCAGLTIRPGTSDLWCVVNERDQLGDDLPPEYATHVKERAFYGWPWFYVGANEDPHHAGQRPELAGMVTAPDILIQPHSAPLGIAFYTGRQFPAEFMGDAFVALHGSWNREKRTGYKIIRLKFANGAPTGEYEDFVTGFVVDDRRVWGRPVGVAQAADGSLLFSDDGAGVIWRVSYKKP